MSTSASEALIADFRATRVTFKSWGTKRALEDVRKDQVAAVFGADTDFLGASKRLVNTKAKAGQQRGVVVVEGIWPTATSRPASASMP